jgi:hypothetical protein
MQSSRSSAGKNLSKAVMNRCYFVYFSGAMEYERHVGSWRDACVLIMYIARPRPPRFKSAVYFLRCLPMAILSFPGKNNHGGLKLLQD